MSLENPLQMFDRLVAAARLDAAPAIDVTSRVLSKIRVRPRAAEPIGLGAAWAVLAASILAASIAVMFGWESWDAVSDPLMQLYAPVEEVMQ